MLSYLQKFFKQTKTDLGKSNCSKKSDPNMTKENDRDKRWKEGT